MNGKTRIINHSLLTRSFQVNKFQFISKAVISKLQFTDFGSEAWVTDIMTQKKDLYWSVRRVSIVHEGEICALTALPC